MKEKILVICAHPDDEVLGCGGSLLKLSKKYDVSICYVADGESSRSNKKELIQKRYNQAKKVGKILKVKKQFFLDFPDNKLDTIPMLEIARYLLKIVKKEKPTIIFTHSINDLNIDHRKTFEATMIAARPSSKNNIKKILSFEILSSTGNFHYKKKLFNPNYFIDIEKFIDQKIELMKIYKDEVMPYPHQRSLKAIKNLSKYRGNQCALKNAEAFELLRFVD